MYLEVKRNWKSLELIKIMLHLEKKLSELNNYIKNNIVYKLNITSPEHLFLVFVLN